MDKENKLALQNNEPTTDFTEEDLRRVTLYKEEGMPGLASLEDVKMHKIMDLYLTGKSYRQISQAVRIDKTLIMYLSQRFNWYLMRREYLHELEMNQRQKIIEAKIESKNFLLELQHMWQYQIGADLNKFLQTGDEKFSKNIDLKVIDRYLKTVDILHKLSYEGGEGKPSIGLNLGDGVTIKKTGNNQVEITPKQKTKTEMLRLLADSRREEENRLKHPDMIESEDKGESNENQ